MQTNSSTQEVTCRGLVMWSLTFVHARIGKASRVFRRLHNVWRCSSIGINTKLRLYLSCPSYCHIYRRNLDRCGQDYRHMLDVFNRQCLRNIQGISQKNHVSNEDLLERTRVDNLHDTVDKIRRRFTSYVFHHPVKQYSGPQKAGEEKRQTQEDMAGHSHIISSVLYDELPPSI